MNKALSASYLNTCIYVIYISYTCIEYHRVLNLKKNKWIFFFLGLFDQELLCLES